ncbi:hypothetical protein [Desulforegula conservatrix]|uniref:hypothetical protein n=1 Tax=Desulforegula conservatrix TaxID=153026 RepID=UPI0004022A97|nr:hypothetical protein [Desulforegula conservatrix]
MTPSERISADTRQSVWNAIREQRTFTSVSILNATSLEDLSSVRWYLSGFETAGYIKKTATDKSPHVFELVKDIGREAPRVRRDGSSITQGSKRDQMWRTMRILKIFDADELAMAASLEESPVDSEDARSYVFHLHKAGYLQLVQAAKHTGGMSRYRLIQSMYTGPKAPMIKKVRQVYDPNLKKVMYQEGRS